MYNCSQAFLTALHKPARFEKLRGTIGSVSFTDANVVSMSYSNRCSDTADLTLGSCYIGQLEATFVNVNILRGEWRDKVITLEWGLVLADSSVEYIPIGVFTVSEATWSGTGIHIKASDNIAKLDKACSSQTSGEIYDLLNLACQTCNITLGMTRAEVEDMPNGEELFGLYPENDIKTWRDYVSWVCQLAGAFAYADRNGALRIKSFSELTIVDEFTETEREYSSQFSDYSTSYAGISVVDIQNKITRYIANGNIGSVINLGSNPFLQFGTKEGLTAQLQDISDSLIDVHWTPFQSGVLSNMAYDLGDLLTCSGGIAGPVDLTCCVMSIDWTSKNLTQLQGFGADPSLTSGKSKTDKNLDGLMKQVAENEVIFYTFENAQSFILGDQEDVRIISLRFGTVNPKIVNIWHEINLDVTADPNGDGVVTCQALYYLDDDLITYSPVTTWDNDGLHLLHLMYFIETLAQNSVHEWEVHLLLNGGTATIDVGDIRASLYGQGLVASDEWDGIIDADDVISANIGGTGFVVSGIEDDILISWLGVEKLDVTDNITATIGNGFVVSLSDTAQIFMTMNEYYWIDELENNIVDENGDAIIFVG